MRALSVQVLARIGVLAKRRGKKAGSFRVILVDYRAGIARLAQGGTKTATVRRSWRYHERCPAWLRRKLAIFHYAMGACIMSSTAVLRQRDGVHCMHLGSFYFCLEKYALLMNTTSFDFYRRIRQTVSTQSINQERADLMRPTDHIQLLTK